MDTPFQALMKAMLNQGWFTKSGGSDDSPLGVFGYVTNTEPELKELREAFEDVTSMYGDVDDKDLIGSFFAYINSNGVIHIYRQANDDQARRQYELHIIEYNEWEDKRSE